MTRSVDRAIIEKLFDKFSLKYGNLWRGRLGENGSWKACEADWLEALQEFDLQTLKKAVKQCFLIYRDFPPTQGQLIDLCIKESGVPLEDEIMNLLVKRDFSHPIVKMIYDKIGSWTLSSGKEHEVRRKIKDYYTYAVIDFRENQDLAWNKLNAHKEQLALEAPIPPKVATNSERKGFKERLAEYMAIAEEGRQRLKDTKPIEFDEKQIKKGGTQFDEYNKYLLSVPEHLILGLPPKYAYDRMRLLSKNDTAHHLREAGYVPENQREGNEAPRNTGGRPTKMYKTWNN